MNYLKHIHDSRIDAFVKSVCCPHSRNIVIADSESRNYVNVFTNLLDTTLHITNFECINIDKNIDYSRQWRKFAVAELDKIDRKLGDQYINEMHNDLEKETIVGPAF